MTKSLKIKSITDLKVQVLLEEIIDQMGTITKNQEIIIIMKETKATK